jgi:hypothetical protein
MKDLKMELMKLDEAIDMITVALDMQEEQGNEYDPQLVKQLAERLKERDELINEINSLH